MSNEAELILRARAITKEAFDQVNKQLDDLDGKSRGTGQSVSSSFSSITSGAASMAAGFVSAQAIMSGVSAAFGFLKESVIGTNATLERSTLQFTTLMKDSDAAKQHVQDLFAFAKATPFETGPIIEASRLMRTFGGAALDTKENLTLIGDASAATGAPINELGMWVGRLYANLKAGEPVGEASMRLMELGVITPETKGKLQDLAESTAPVGDKFKVLQDVLGNFSGAMEKQAGSWDGVMSTFSDTINLLTAETFKPFFELIRDGMAKVNEYLGSEGFTAFATNVSTAVRDYVVVGIELAKDAFASLQSYGDMLASRWADIVGVAQAVWRALGEVDVSAGSLRSAFAGLFAVSKGVWDVTVLGAEVVVALVDKLGLLTAVSKIVNVALEGLSFVLRNAGGLFSWLADQVRWVLESVGLLDTKIAPPKKQIEALGVSASTTGKHVAEAGRVVTTAGAAMSTAFEGASVSSGKAEKGAKGWAAVMGELNTASTDHQAMLNTINGTTAEAVKYYLEAGVSQANLAKAYGLTTVQVGALADELKRASEMQKQLTELSKKEHEQPALKSIGAKIDWREMAPNPDDMKPIGDGITTALRHTISTSYQELKPTALTVGQAMAKDLGGAFSGAFAAVGPSMLSAIQGGGSVIQAAGGAFGSYLTGPNGLGSEAIKTALTGSLGKTIGGAIGSMIPMIGPLLGPLIGKFGEWMGKLFGGPSEEELKGRTAAGEFRAQVNSILSESQRLEAAGDRQKALHIAIRDAIKDKSISEQEASRLSRALWAAEREGPEAVKRVIAEINQILATDTPEAIKEVGAAVEDTVAAMAAAAEARMAKIKSIVSSMMGSVGRVADNTGGDGALETEWTPGDDMWQFALNNGFNDIHRFAEGYAEGSDARNRAGNEAANWLKDDHTINGVTMSGSDWAAQAAEEKRQKDNEEAERRRLMGFATGGVVDAPMTGQRVTVHGLEAIIPLDRPSAIGGQLAKDIAAQQGTRDNGRLTRLEALMERLTMTIALMPGTLERAQRDAALLAGVR